METFSALLAICAGNSPHKGQWRGVLIFSLICVWINGWVNNREAGDLRPYRAHYDVIVMKLTMQPLSNKLWFVSIANGNILVRFSPYSVFILYWIKTLYNAFLIDLSFVKFIMGSHIYKILLFVKWLKFEQNTLYMWNPFIVFPLNLECLPAN